MIFYAMFLFEGKGVSQDKEKGDNIIQTVRRMGFFPYANDMNTS